MGLNRAGHVLLVVGAACIAFYVLAAMRGVSQEFVRAGGVAFYAGVALLLTGSVLRWVSRR